MTGILKFYITKILTYADIYKKRPEAFLQLDNP